jgi:hypothetical protein
MKRAVLSQPIHPAEAYRQDFEELTGDGKTEAEETRATMTCFVYVLFAGVALVSTAIGTVLAWWILP